MNTTINSQPKRYDDHSTTQLDILRHGECEGGHIFRGKTDVPLLPFGMKKMQLACTKADVPWDLVVSSPLLRCAKFAEKITRELNIPLEKDDRLREMSFGDWEGQLINDVWSKHEDQLQAWRKDPSQFTPPNGEPLSELCERVAELKESLISKNKGKKVLIVTHGGVIRVLLSMFLSMPRSAINRFDVPYASMTRLAIYHSAKGYEEKLLAHNFV